MAGPLVATSARLAPAGTPTRTHPLQRPEEKLLVTSGPEQPMEQSSSAAGALVRVAVEEKLVAALPNWSLARTATPTSTPRRTDAGSGSQTKRVAGPGSMRSAWAAETSPVPWAVMSTGPAVLPEK